MNASFFNQEANIEEPCFSISLKVEVYSYSYDIDDEKEVTNGATIDIVYDSLKNSVFSMSYIIDFDIYMPYLSHLLPSQLFSPNFLNFGPLLMI